MRIVETDNFGGDYPDEKFVLGFIFDETKAQNVADAINAAHSPSHPRFWKVVDNDYKLSPGFEP